MHESAEERASQLIESYGEDKALQAAKDILAMYTRGLNAYWVEYYKRVVETIDIYIEENK
jgi:hypothetical protein